MTHAANTPTALTTSGNILSTSDTQQTLWAVTNAGETNDSLIAPQLLATAAAAAATAETVTTTDLLNANNNNNTNSICNEASSITDTTLLHESTIVTRPETAPTNTVIPQAPKSPPRWPLRPGVMLHVSTDTKVNLAVNRMTLKPTSSNNTSLISGHSGQLLTSSPLLSHTTNTLGRPSKHTALALSFNMAATLPLRGKKLRTNERQAKANDAHIIALDTESAAVEQRQSSKFERCIEQFLGNLFRRAKRHNRSDTTRDSQRSHVGLLGGVFGRSRGNFWRRQNPADDCQFSTKHRLKGIRCSGSGN